MGSVVDERGDEEVLIGERKNPGVGGWDCPRRELALHSRRADN
jgi:hypothetical protein